MSSARLPPQMTSFRCLRKLLGALHEGHSKRYLLLRSTTWNGDGPTDTPGSVIPHCRRCGSGGHPSTNAVADALQRPTRALGRAALITRTVWPCSGWGLPSRAGHPARWWSLTPPFHPYPPAGMRRKAVYFLWHWPAGYPEWALPTTLPCGARTFLGGFRAECTALLQRGRLVDPSEFDCTASEGPGRPALRPRCRSAVCLR